MLLEVKKSFAQNGAYEGPSITFNGGTDQRFPVARQENRGLYRGVQPGEFHQGGLGHFENVTVALSDATSKGTVDMNGFKLFVSGGATALITDDTSNHVPRIEYTNIAGINCADGAIITSPASPILPPQSPSMACSRRAVAVLAGRR